MKNCYHMKYLQLNYRCCHNGGKIKKEKRKIKLLPLIVDSLTTITSVTCRILFKFVLLLYERKVALFHLLWVWHVVPCVCYSQFVTFCPGTIKACIISHSASQALISRESYQQLHWHKSLRNCCKLESCRKS